MEEEQRLEAELLIKKVIKEKTFVSLTPENKTLLLDVYDEEMKEVSKNYKKYLQLSETDKLVNIVVFVLKEYIGSWHVTTEEMEEISKYIESISKLKS